MPAEIHYVVADMTESLPAELAAGDMAAVFNIGSSFGYESSDDTNIMVFRNAAKALRPGAPFVFEFVNGPHWENKTRATPGGRYTVGQRCYEDGGYHH